VVIKPYVPRTLALSRILPQKLHSAVSYNCYSTQTLIPQTKEVPFLRCRQLSVKYKIKFHI